MVKSVAAKRKKRGKLIAIRLPREMIVKIDEWVKRSGAESRSETIRHLLELALAGSRGMPRPNARGASKASDMAGQVIDKLGDPTATSQERQTRKRRLLEGPKEFRNIRRNLPRPKR
jgi:Arc/MetJ-type ribon-helix-helix transcriptional regulator